MSEAASWASLVRARDRARAGAAFPTPLRRAFAVAVNGSPHIPATDWVYVRMGTSTGEIQRALNLGNRQLVDGQAVDLEQMDDRSPTAWRIVGRDMVRWGPIFLTISIYALQDVVYQLSDDGQRFRDVTENLPAIRYLSVNGGSTTHLTLESIDSPFESMIWQRDPGGAWATWGVQRPHSLWYHLNSHTVMPFWLLDALYVVHILASAGPTPLIAQVDTVNADGTTTPLSSVGRMAINGTNLLGAEQDIYTAPNHARSRLTVGGIETMVFLRVGGFNASPYTSRIEVLTFDGATLAIACAAQTDPQHRLHHEPAPGYGGMPTNLTRHTDGWLYFGMYRHVYISSFTTTEQIDVWRTNLVTVSLYATLTGSTGSASPTPRGYQHVFSVQGLLFMLHGMPTVQPYEIRLSRIETNGTFTQIWSRFSSSALPILTAIADDTHIYYALSFVPNSTSDNHVYRYDVATGIETEYTDLTTISAFVLPREFYFIGARGGVD